MVGGIREGLLVPAHAGREDRLVAEVEQREDLRGVLGDLARLPDDQREAVLLVMVEGYPYKEAAEIVGCPIGTLNSRLVRGRDALLAKLGDGV